MGKADFVGGSGRILNSAYSVPCADQGERRMNTARLKAWIGYTLAVEEVERRLGLSWGAAQKALLEACERGELRWRNTPGGGPDIGDPDLFDWLEAKRSHPPSFKQSRILKLLAGMFSNHRVPAPELCPRKTLRADLLKLDPLLKPLDEATLKSAIDKYNTDPKRS